MSVWPYVTPVHPAKIVGRSEVPFGKDTRMVSSNIVLDRGPGPPREWEIWESEPQSKFAFQIAAKPLQIV